MIYEILSIEPAEGENDVVAEVHYWYGNIRIPGKADFVEHHSIHNIPEPRPIRVPVMSQDPELAAIGYYQGIDGIPVPPWYLLEGKWMKGIPWDRIEYIEAPAPPITPRIEGPIDRRAAEVARDKPQGRDAFAQGEIKPNKSQAHVMRRYAAQMAALKGRRRTI